MHHHHSFRLNEYLQWDNALESSLSPDELMESMSEDILRDGNLDLSLQRAFRWGSPGMDGAGLNELIERLRQQRQELLDQFDFGSSLDEIREKLDDILGRETDTIQDRKNQLSDQSDLEASDVDRLSEYLNRREETLAQLPASTAARIEHLKDYEFVDAQAGRDFDELVKQLQQQISDALFNNLMGGLPQQGDGSAQQMQEFLQDLNDAFEQERLGQQPDMDKLNNNWANQLGGRAENMSEIRDRLRRRMEAAQNLMSMLSREQRAQMQAMIQQSLQDSGLMEQFMRLQSHIGPLDRSNLQQAQGPGDQDIPLDIAMQVLDRASQMEQLEGQLRSVHRPQELRGLDKSLIDEVLNDQDQEWLDRWSGIEDQLIDAGFVKKGRRGLELTPKAVRRIGEKALEDVYSSLKNQGIGEHDVQRQGAAGELVETSRRWSFGDPFVLDLPKTVMNGVMRNGPGTPVRLDPSHFEVQDREARTATATVLLIDMSRSMIHNGCWDAAKRSALALDTLIRGKYPRDMLELFGFSATAHPLKMVDLPTLEWNEYNYGTNLQHALELAREKLRPERGRNRQIIVITDGEPTAHIDRGEVRFQYPPTRETFEATLREVVRCTREDITINTFLLESTPHMSRFVEDLMRINRGRVINASPNRLGNYVLKDFLRGRTASRGSGEMWA
ncbi:MAG: VWA domain-containing protein [Chloroflexia bacterium]|nr:VWA domain-containing protein [Chloroflexia bacterium]